jgi:hypothetical protein
MILSKSLFLRQKCIPHPPKKNSANLHESQELSGPLPKKLKSVKILKISTMNYTDIQFHNCYTPTK